MGGFKCPLNFQENFDWLVFRISPCSLIISKIRRIPIFRQNFSCWINLQIIYLQRHFISINQKSSINFPIWWIFRIFWIFGGIRDNEIQSLCQFFPWCHFLDSRWDVVRVNRFMSAPFPLRAVRNVPSLGVSMDKKSNNFSRKGITNFFVAEKMGPNLSHHGPWWFENWQTQAP